MAEHMLTSPTLGGRAEAERLWFGGQPGQKQDPLSNKRMNDYLL